MKVSGRGARKSLQFVRIREAQVFSTWLATKSQGCPTTQTAGHRVGSRELRRADRVFSVRRELVREAFAAPLVGLRPDSSKGLLCLALAPRVRPASTKRQLCTRALCCPPPAPEVSRW